MPSERAEITSILIPTAGKGDGTIVFSAEKIPAAIRAGGRGIPCTTDDISTFSQNTLAAAAINADRTIDVPRAALTAIGVGDVMGARLIVQRLHAGVGSAGERPAAETRDVVKVSEKRIGPGNMLRLTLSPRIDATDGGTE